MRQTYKMQNLLTAFLFSALLCSVISVAYFGCAKKQPPAAIQVASTPTPTPLPGSLVFVQHGHLVRCDLNSNPHQTTPLTGGKSNEWFPSCSPSGDQVAFWSNAGGSAYNLWKINLDGKNRTQLTFDEISALDAPQQNPLLNDFPNWSSDGTKIIYSLAGDIWTIDSDGYNPETLLAGHQAFCPSFSPDGKSILFVSIDESGIYSLWTMNLTDRKLNKLYQDSEGWNVGSPSYSKDGKIIFNRFKENQTQIYTVNVDGSSPVPHFNSNSTLCPRFAQNGSKIVYCSFETGDGKGLEIFMANGDYNDSHSEGLEDASSPSWASASALSAVPPTPSATVVSSANLPTPVGK